MLHKTYSKGCGHHILKMKEMVKDGRWGVKSEIAEEASLWLDWRSKDGLKNPITLLLLELACKAKMKYPHCKQPRSRIAKMEYF